VNKKPHVDRPGQFLYYGGMVFEVDNCLRRRPRKDIKPGHRGKYKHKFFKPSKSCRR
jgi:hypothetical protein